VNGRALTLQESQNLCSQALLGGLDTVAALLGFALLFLARHPAHRRQLTDDPSKIPAAVDEIVRRFGIAVPARVVRQDHEREGVQLRAGDMVVLPTLLHGLDEAEYTNPLEVDFNRDGRSISTFGNGAHVCPGQFLGRAELRITLEEWLRHIPDFGVAPDAGITMTSGIVGAVDRLPLVWPAPAPT
jgi:cytochrome P450